MDDTFLLFREKIHAALFLNYLNSQHTSIKFTAEFEQNDKLPFLDCLVKRNTTGFETSVFRKDTFSGLGISFFSFCVYKFKINAIKTLLFRAYKYMLQLSVFTYGI